MVNLVCGLGGADTVKVLLTAYLPCRIGSTYNLDSGTSMATPHVAGFAAYLLGLDSSLTVEEIKAAIDCYATRNAIKLTDPGQYWF